MTLRSLIALLIMTVSATGTGVCQVYTAAQAVDHTVTCSILQYTQGRLYFPVGEESYVYEFAPLTILLDSSVIEESGIEHSWLGISVSDRLSDSLASILDTIPLNRIAAVIEAAPIDSAAVITFGTDIMGLASLLQLGNNPRVTIREYAYRPGMLEDFNTGTLDACLSFSNLSVSADCDSLSSPAPFIATLIPNIKRDCNQEAKLTTSLYYRYDASRLPLVFAGDKPLMQNRLHIYHRDDEDTDPGRWFPFDPRRGRELVASCTAPSSLGLSLYYGHDTLEKLALFFADILARDRCKVELTRNRAQADLYMDYIPVSTNLPSVSLYTLYQRLAADSLSGHAVNENVRQMAAYFRFVESAPDEEEYYRNLEAAEQVAIDDLGVFPLFRPTLYLAVHRDIRQLRFTDDGALDTFSMRRVILPTPPRGIQ